MLSKLEDHRQESLFAVEDRRHIEDSARQIVRRQLLLPHH